MNSGFSSDVASDIQRKSEGTPSQGKMDAKSGFLPEFGTVSASQTTALASQFHSGPAMTINRRRSTLGNSTGMVRPTTGSARKRHSTIVRPATALVQPMNGTGMRPTTAAVAAAEVFATHEDHCSGIRIETMEDLKAYMEEKMEELQQSQNDQVDALNKLLSEEKTAFKLHCKRALSTIDKGSEDDQGQWGRLMNVQRMRLERLGQHQKQARVELDLRHKEETQKVKKLLGKQLEAHHFAKEADKRQKAIVKILNFLTGEDFKKLIAPPEIEYQHLFRDIMNDYWNRQEKSKKNSEEDRRATILGDTMESVFAHDHGNLDAPLSYHINGGFQAPDIWQADNGFQSSDNWQTSSSFRRPSITPKHANLSFQPPDIWRAPELTISAQNLEGGFGPEIASMPNNNAKKKSKLSPMFQNPGRISPEPSQDQSYHPSAKDQITPPPGVTLGVVKQPDGEQSPKSKAYLEAHRAMAQASGHLSNQDDVPAEFQGAPRYTGPQSLRLQDPMSNLVGNANACQQFPDFQTYAAMATGGAYTNFQSLQGANQMEIGPQGMGFPLGQPVLQPFKRPIMQVEPEGNHPGRLVPQFSSIFEDENSEASQSTASLAQSFKLNATLTANPLETGDAEGIYATETPDVGSVMRDLVRAVEERLASNALVHHEISHDVTFLKDVATSDSVHAVLGMQLVNQVSEHEQSDKNATELAQMDDQNSDIRKIDPELKSDPQESISSRKRSLSNDSSDDSSESNEKILFFDEQRQVGSLDKGTQEEVVSDDTKPSAPAIHSRSLDVDSGEEIQDLDVESLENENMELESFGSTQKEKSPAKKSNHLDPSEQVGVKFAANGWMSSDMKPIDLSKMSDIESFKINDEDGLKNEHEQLKSSRHPNQKHSSDESGKHRSLDPEDSRGISAGTSWSFHSDVSEITTVDKFELPIKPHGMSSETARSTPKNGYGYNVGFTNQQLQYPGSMGGPSFPNRQLQSSDQPNEWEPEYLRHLRLQYENLRLQYEIMKMQHMREQGGFQGVSGSFGHTVDGLDFQLHGGPHLSPLRPRRHTLLPQRSQGTPFDPSSGEEEELKSSQGSSPRRWSVQGEMHGRTAVGTLDHLLAMHANTNCSALEKEAVNMKDNVPIRVAITTESESIQKQGSVEQPSKLKRRLSLRDSLRASFARRSFGSFFSKMESGQWEGPADNTRSYKDPQKTSLYTSAWLVRFLALVNMICCVVYIWWRITRTFVNVQYPLYSYSYFVAELMLIIMVWLSHTSRSFPVKRPLVYMEDLAKCDRFISDCSRVAILIPVTNERLECVLQAIFGALSQNDWGSNFHRKHQLRVVVVDTKLRPAVAHLVKLIYQLMKAVLDPQIQELLILEGLETTKIKELYDFMMANQQRLITNFALELAVKIHNLVHDCDNFKSQHRRGLKRRKESTTPMALGMKDIPVVNFGDTKQYKEVIELPWLSYHCSKDLEGLGIQSKIGTALNFTLFSHHKKSALIGHAEIIAVSPPKVCLGSEFLERTVPYFFELYGDDEKSYRWSNVGLVTTNTVMDTSLTPAGRFWGSRASYFGIIQKGRDGTFSTLPEELQDGASVWRADALVRGFSPEGQGGEVSNKLLLQHQGTLVGFCTQTCAPAYHTSVRLLNKGWRSVYLNRKEEKLATFLAISKTLDQKLRSLQRSSFRRAQLFWTCGTSILSGDSFPTLFTKFIILEDMMFTILNGFTGFILVIMAWLFSMLGTPPINVNSGDSSAFVGLFLMVMITSWLPTFVASKWRKITIYFVLKDLQVLYISSFLSIYSFFKAFFSVAFSKLKVNCWVKIGRIRSKKDMSTEILAIKIIYYLLMICPLLSIAVAIQKLMSIDVDFSLILGYLAGIMSSCISFILLGSFIFEDYNIWNAVVEDVFIGVFICAIIAMFVFSKL